MKGKQAAPLAGLTPRQETFAAGLAQGLSQAEAFRRANPRAEKWKPETVWSKASEMAAQGKVAARVAELTSSAAEANGFTVDEHLRTLTELRDEARAVEQFPAAIKAEELRGKCAGFYAEKIQVTGPGGGPLQSVSLSAEEFRRIALEVAART